jgi:hypothetical protein
LQEPQVVSLAQNPPLQVVFFDHAKQPLALATHVRNCLSAHTVVPTGVHSSWHDGVVLALQAPQKEATNRFKYNLKMRMNFSFSGENILAVSCRQYAR